MSERIIGNRIILSREIPIVIEAINKGLPYHCSQPTNADSPLTTWDEEKIERNALSAVIACIGLQTTYDRREERVPFGLVRQTRSYGNSTLRSRLTAVTSYEQRGFRNRAIKVADDLRKTSYLDLRDTIEKFGNSHPKILRRFQILLNRYTLSMPAEMVDAEEADRILEPAYFVARGSTTAADFSAAIVVAASQVLGKRMKAEIAINDVLTLAYNSYTLIVEIAKGNIEPRASLLDYILPKQEPHQVATFSQGAVQLGFDQRNGREVLQLKTPTNRLNAAIFDGEPSLVTTFCPALVSTQAVADALDLPRFDFSNPIRGFFDYYLEAVKKVETPRI